MKIFVSAQPSGYQPATVAAATVLTPAAPTMLTITQHPVGSEARHAATLFIETRDELRELIAMLTDIWENP